MSEPPKQLIFDFEQASVIEASGKAGKPSKNKSRVILKSPDPISTMDGIEVIKVDTKDPFEVLKLLNRVSKGGLEDVAISYDGQRPVPALQALTDLNKNASLEKLAKELIPENGFSAAGKVSFMIPHLIITPYQFKRAFGENPKISRFEQKQFSLGGEDYSLVLKTKTKVPLPNEENNLCHAILFNKAVLAAPYSDQPNHLILRLKPMHDFIVQTNKPVTRSVAVPAKTFDRHF